MTPSAPSVLFVCVKNGGKSQMAAALMRHRAEEASLNVDVHSAGTRPGNTVNQLSAEVISEAGADMAAEVPKPIDADLLGRADRVIVLGDDARVEPVEDMRATIETWHTDEPSHRGIEGAERMRLVRDDIDQRIRTLLTELTATLGPHNEVGNPTDVSVADPLAGHCSYSQHALPAGVETAAERLTNPAI